MIKHQLLVSTSILIYDRRVFKTLTRGAVKKFYDIDARPV